MGVLTVDRHMDLGRPGGQGESEETGRGEECSDHEALLLVWLSGAR
jgi:hypothetical protein